MSTEWTIQGRTHACAVTGKPFAEGEYFHTLLFMEGGNFRREDLCDEAFQARNDNLQPFSHWRAKYVPPPPPEQEAVSKQTAEDLLRQYMLESNPEHANARYILALMLERKRLLKEVEVKRGEDGSLTRIYVHTKSGEAFIIPDPQLRLDQVAEVQAQVAGYLGGPPPGQMPGPPAPAPSAAPAPETAPVSQEGDPSVASKAPEPPEPSETPDAPGDPEAPLAPEAPEVPGDPPAPQADEPAREEPIGDPS